MKKAKSDCGIDKDFWKNIQYTPMTGLVLTNVCWGEDGCICCSVVIKNNACSVSIIRDI